MCVLVQQADVLQLLVLPSPGSWPHSGTRKLSSREPLRNAKGELLSTPGFVPTDPKDKTYFEVPLWQRPYRWGEAHQARLAEDLLKRVRFRLCDVHSNLSTTTDEDLLQGDAEKPHAMSTIVLFRPDSSGLTQIVDGQQRLLTLAMMIAVLHELACKWAQHEAAFKQQQSGSSPAQAAASLQGLQR